MTPSYLTALGSVVKQLEEQLAAEGTSEATGTVQRDSTSADTGFGSWGGAEPMSSAPCTELNGQAVRQRPVRTGLVVGPDGDLI